MKILMNNLKKEYDIYLKSFFTIEDLHNDYIEMMNIISKELNIKLYLLDATSSTHLHYISLDRKKVKNLIKYLIENKFYFYFSGQNIKETFYNKEKISLDSLNFDDIYTLKIYKRYYYKENNYLVFGYREAIIIDFWRYEDGLYKSNIYSKYGRMIAKEIFKENITSININGIKIPCLKICKENYETFLNNPVDIVYTWVDSNDKKWLSKKNKVLKNLKKNYHITANDKARFINNNELLYSLRSIFTYLKGFNNVYIVTDNQVPPFLKRNKKIKIIDHTKIFKDKTKLPTFNSNAIESQLHHIRGLSKKYLYFNDDIFITRANTMELFFDEYNKAKCFFSTHVSIPATNNSDSYTPVDNAAINNKKVLEKVYKIKIFKKFKHTPVPVLRDEMKYIEKKFKYIFDITTSNKIRDKSDYSIAGAFYYHHGLITGKVIPSDLKYLYIDLGEKESGDKLEKILSDKESKRFDVVCINSTLYSQNYLNNSKKFQSILNKCFPYKGFWEK